MGAEKMLRHLLEERGIARRLFNDLGQELVAPIIMQHYVILQRNLLYTCITRTKKVLVLVGSRKAIAIAVSNNKIEKRNTMLCKQRKEGTGSVEL